MGDPAIQQYVCRTYKMKYLPKIATTWYWNHFESNSAAAVDPWIKEYYLVLKIKQKFGATCFVEVMWELVMN